mmetsp:Transcript_29422/g.94010  ORF Transcript_29422/g.94010 Transcript_29422/m.94010 type:complete len:224 (+) Transcript_29422:689-1360(+)
MRPAPPAAPAPWCGAVCATMTAWYDSQPRPAVRCDDAKPQLLKAARHCSHDMSGLSLAARKASFLKSHQPSVWPKTTCTKRNTRTASLTTRAPPGRSSWRQWRRAVSTLGVAWSTLAATTRSSSCEAKPCSLGSASMLSSAASKQANEPKRRAAWRRKKSDTSVKMYRSHAGASTGRTCAAVPPVPAPTSSAPILRPSGSWSATDRTAATVAALYVVASTFVS